MDIDCLQFSQMLQFLNFSELSDEIAMDVQCFEARKLLETVIKRREIIMRDVNPLKIADIVHNGSKDSVQTGKISDFVVAQHEGRTDQLYVDCFLLLFLEFLLCLQGNVLHGRGRDHRSHNRVDIILRQQFDDLILLLISLGLSIFASLSALFFLLVLADLHLCLFLLHFLLLSLSRLDILQFYLNHHLHAICLMFLNEKSKGGAS